MRCICGALKPPGASVFVLKIPAPCWTNTRRGSTSGLRAVKRMWARRLNDPRRGKEKRCLIFFHGRWGGWPHGCHVCGPPPNAPSWKRPRVQGAERAAVDELLSRETCTRLQWGVQFGLKKTTTWRVESVILAPEMETEPCESENQPSPMEVQQQSTGRKI